MSYYIYAKSETFQVTYKVNYYKAIMKLIWVLIFASSWFNDLLWLFGWLMWVEYPIWVNIAMSVNLFVSLASAEVLGIGGESCD